MTNENHEEATGETAPVFLFISIGPNAARMSRAVCKSLPDLADAFRHPTAIWRAIWRRKQAAIAHYKILARGGGDEATRGLVSAMNEAQRDPDPAVRAAAALGLSVLRADPALTGPALLRAAVDGDAWGRAQAVSELACGLPPKWARRADVHDAIIFSLGDADGHVKQAAILCLGKFGTRARTALPALHHSQHDDDSGVQSAAVQIVRSIENEVQEEETAIAGTDPP
jgi:HEAT repeat protein